jgi:ADP-heptose:LPS heptosyltransferase
MTARFPPLPVGEGARGWGPAPSRDYVVLHPGAGGKRKRWPAEGFAEIARRCRQLGYDVLVTSGPADDEAVEAVVAACQKGPDGLAPRVLAGLGLPELACILAGASAFVGNDSGITHLAGLVGAPTVAIFGPFDPAYWAPLGRRVTVVDAGVACTHRQDPRDGCHLCNLLASLPVNSVWNAGLAALEASRVERGRA